jgi:hypothetical protein
MRRQAIITFLALALVLVLGGTSGLVTPPVVALPAGGR